MKFTDDFIGEIKNKNDIFSVVSEFVELKKKVKI